MYSMVLMVALSGSAELPDCHRRGGCCGCHGGCYGGCHGGCYGGCHGGCYGGCHGGCYGGVMMPPATPRGGAEQVKPPKKTGEKEEANLGPASATLIVTLPADAKLSIDGNATRSTSSVRRFTTPPLDAGKDFFYTLTAEVAAEGKTEVITQRVMVHAGQVTQTTLTLPIATASAR